MGVHICMCGPNISKFLFLFPVDLLNTILMSRGAAVLMDKEKHSGEENDTYSHSENRPL